MLRGRYRAKFDIQVLTRRREFRQLRKGWKRDDQVLTQTSQTQPDKSRSNQRDSDRRGQRCQVPPTLVDQGDVKSTRNSERSRPRRRSGWKALAGLRWREVRSVFDLLRAAAKAGLPFNWLVTIRAPASLEDDEMACKRWFSRKAAHISQAVRGRGKVRRQQDFIAVTVYEKRPGGPLHAHILCHVARGNDALARLSDDVLIHSRRAKPSDAGYITKQRLPLSPEFEAQIKHNRQASVKIAGVRISFTADAKALLRAHAAVSRPSLAVAEWRLETTLAKTGMRGPTLTGAREGSPSDPP